MRTKITKIFWAMAVGLFAMACGPEGTEGGADPVLTVDPTEISVQDDGVITGTTSKQAMVAVESTSDIAVSVDADAKAWLTATKMNKTTIRVTAKANKDGERTGNITVTNTEGLSATIKVVQMGMELSLTLDEDYVANPIAVEAEGKEFSLNVYANLPFAVSFDGEEQDWVSFEATESKVVVTVEETPLFEERTATLVIAPVDEAQAALAKKVVINQAAKTYAITATCVGLENGAVTVPAVDAELEFAVEANDLWTAASEAEWISIDPAEGSVSTTETLVVFSENTEAAERTATITFTCGTATQEVAVTQRGAGCFLEVEDVTEVVVASEETTVNIPFATNASSVSVSADANWVSGSADIEAGNIELSISENTGAAREAVVTITGSIVGYEDVVVTIPVKQGQMATNLAVNPDSGEEETANCYAIHAAGSYKFPATVKGNGALFLDGEGFEDESLTPASGFTIKEENIASASLLWSTKNAVDPVTQESTGLLTNVSYSAGYVYFDIETFEVGNAGIAIKDIDGTVLWSWHIWATPFDVNAAENTFPIGMTADGEGNEHVTGYAKPSTFMGLNLGATHSGNNGNATDEELTAAMGMMYEWGRKDPFVGGKIGGGNQVIYYHDMDIDLPEELIVMESTEAGFYTTTPPFGDLWETNEWAIAHPTVFLHSVGIYSDNCWLSNLPTDYGEPDPNCNSSAYWGHLWGNASSSNGSEGSKSIYDPCPPGWQVPCADHFHIITSHGDNIGPYYGCYAPWKYNVQETVDLINEYGFGEGVTTGFNPWAKKQNDNGTWSWDSDNAVQFSVNWKHGFNVFTGTSNTTDGASGDLVADATVDGSQDRNIEYLKDAGTVPMFLPAGGWRMGYNGNSLNSIGDVCRYHLNQPSNIAPEAATWTKYMGKAMSMWQDGSFYRDSAHRWNEWHGNGQAVRCIKPVEEIYEE